MTIMFTPSLTRPIVSPPQRPLKFGGNKNEYHQYIQEYLGKDNEALKKTLEEKTTNQLKGIIVNFWNYNGKDFIKETLSNSVDLNKLLDYWNSNMEEIGNYKQIAINEQIRSNLDDNVDPTDDFLRAIDLQLQYSILGLKLGEAKYENASENKLIIALILKEAETANKH